MRMNTFLSLAAVASFLLLISVQLSPAAQNKGNNKDKAAAASQPDASTSAQMSATPGAIEKRVEDFLRNWYAWGPEFHLKVGPAKPSQSADLLEVPVEITAAQGSEQATVYVTKDGKFMMRGDLQDLTKDPIADTRHELDQHLAGYASKGPADAKVTLVEFGDFECPSCRQLDFLLRGLLPQVPQVRLIFKDFPLESIHPWAMTAAIAGHCVLNQSSDAFWKFHDAVYDSQDVISPENAFEKLTDIAVQSGANKDSLQACMSDSKPKELVQQSMQEGNALDVNSTPTTFVNGRRLVGPNQALLEQFLQFDLPAATPAPTHN